MEVDFYDWRAWVILIIIVFIVLWIYIKLSGSDSRSGTRTSSYDAPTRSKEDVRVGSPLIVTTVSDQDASDEAITQLPTVLSLTREEVREHDTFSEQKQGQSAGERECIKVFRELYGSEVVVQTRKCKWLVNPMTGKALELDVFAPRAMVACEYDGAQHRKVVPRFHPYGQKSLEYQQWKDAYKDAACKHRGVHLIRVPDIVPVNKIRGYILARLPEGTLVRNVTGTRSITMRDA